MTAKQYVVAQLLHQLPLRADREERLQQQGPQQLLGRDRGPSGQRVRADRTRATDAPAPRSPAGGSGAVDDPAAPAPPGPRGRPGDLADDPARASASLSVPALVSGNQIDAGFYKGFFRSLLRVQIHIIRLYNDSALRS